MSSAAAIPVHVGVADESGRVSASDLAKVCGALNAQVSGEFFKVWRTLASVGPYLTIPPHMWQILIRHKLDVSGALGYHTTKLNQPISYVMYTPDYSGTTSHEALEMLADPSGNRMHGGRLPWGVEDKFRDFGLKSKNSHVNYLLEVCDPPEATSYEIGDVLVSDFILPSWYDSTPVAGVRYSWAGGCKKPREVANGGYVSFCVGDHWFQVFNQGGNQQISDLGVFNSKEHASLREFTDLHARLFRGL